MRPTCTSNNKLLLHCIWIAWAKRGQICRREQVVRAAQRQNRPTKMASHQSRVSSWSRLSSTSQANCFLWWRTSRKLDTFLKITTTLLLGSNRIAKTAWPKPSKIIKFSLKRNWRSKADDQKITKKHRIRTVVVVRWQRSAERPPWVKW